MGYADCHGFECVRTRGAHRQYRGVVAGETKLVTVDCSQFGEDITAKKLASMIRQSGLPKKTVPVGQRRPSRARFRHSAARSQSCWWTPRLARNWRVGL